MANFLATDVLGCPEPPGLLKKTVGMMGLKGVPGLNVVSALPEYDGKGGGGRPISRPRDRDPRSAGGGGGRGGRVAGRGGRGEPRSEYGEYRGGVSESRGGRGGRGAGRGERRGYSTDGGYESRESRGEYRGGRGAGRGTGRGERSGRGGRGSGRGTGQGRAQRDWTSRDQMLGTIR